MATDFNSLLLAGGGWHDGSRTLTYSFNASMTATEAALMQQAVDAMNAVANINMVAAPAGTVGDLEFHSVATQYLGYAYYPLGGTIGTPSISGDVFISNSVSIQLVNQLGHTSWNTYLHELGHALGLSHPNDAPTNGDPTNNNQYTVMSYLGHPSFSGQSLANQAWGLTPMLYDIEALQALYGANTSHLNGNTTYFGPGIGATETAFRDDDMRIDVNGLPMVVTIWDGGGTDTIDASIVNSASVIDLKNGAFSTIGPAANNVAIASAVVQGGVIVNLIENAIGGGGNDRITGNGGNNALSGRDGTDTLIGAAGNDRLDGGTGSDLLDGGSGNDTFVTDGSDTMTEAAGGGTDTVQAAVSFTLGLEFEALVLTGALAINGTGNARSNAITGNGAANVLNGAGGSDVLAGGGGSDIYLVDGGDTVSEGATAGTDTVQSSASFTLGANVERLILTGSAATNGTGNTLANILTGNGAANALNGGGGADSLIGKAGDDTYRTDGGDAISEVAGGGTDTVQSSVSFTLGAQLERLVLTGSGAISGTGNSLANTIQGNAAANFINGGAAADVLAGGGGADHFVFSTALVAGNVDRVTDFLAPADTIRIENAIFTGLRAGGLAKGAFVANLTGKAEDASDRIIHEKDTGYLYFDRDGAGGAGRVLFADLASGLNLTHGDFFVI